MFKKILLNKRLSRLKSPETIIVGACKIAKNCRRRWISRSRFDNARRWYATLCSKPQDSKFQRKSMFAMKFRYSKFRHSASEPKEKRNELSLRSEIVGKTRRARSNGLCSASRRATWCSESRERSALDNLRHVYVHFAKPRPEKKKGENDGESTSTTSRRNSEDRWSRSKVEFPSLLVRYVVPFDCYVTSIE